MNVSQRRAAKAVRRKALVQAKQRAETKARSKTVDWRRGTSAAALPSRKASAALIEFAEPLTDCGDDRDTRYKCLTLAMVAWNLSLLLAGERREKMRWFFDKLPGLSETEGPDQSTDSEAGFSWFEGLMTGLISRKLLLYPLDRRWLLNLEVIEIPDGYRVNVASTLDTAA